MAGSQKYSYLFLWLLFLSTTVTCSGQSRQTTLTNDGILPDAISDNAAQETSELQIAFDPIDQPDLTSFTDSVSPHDTKPDTSIDDSANIELPDLDISENLLDSETQGDSDVAYVCTPGQKFCHEGSVVQCNEDGSGWTTVENCDDGNECTNDFCEDGKCIHELVSGNCCYPPCGVGEVCINNECVCIPNCVGKECGDDGCGGSCGDCPEGYECIMNKCQCVPQCEEKECGDDGCGGSCGTCPQGYECQNGKCVCIPQCEGKECGDDGCGGLCGLCPKYYVCQEGTCVFQCNFCPQLQECTSYVNGTHIYYVCDNTEKNWYGAKQYCIDQGTHLVTILSQEEQDFVVSVKGDHSYWLGLSQTLEDWDWVWKWVTGEDLVFEAWAEGQPDDGGPFTMENCAEMKKDGLWNDVECLTTKRKIICEFDLP